MKQFFIFLMLWLGFFVSSCVWNAPPNPSFLVISAESLKMSDVMCDHSSHWAGDFKGAFEVLCDESVRFTHAFTPSALSQPAMSSLLTGQYPHQHGVRNNGNQFLSAKVHTVGEEALGRGYRTSFFSGGPPIWSKGGFHQGFEHFDDSSQLKPKKYFRSTKEVVARFLQWLDRSKAQKPFFSFMYLADLQFPDYPSVTKQGIGRSRSIKSQLASIDEALGDLIVELKRRGLWDNTYIVLTGLNGRPTGTRRAELTGINLFSDNTQVALFFKPAIKEKRDLGISWQVNHNVTLADVGKTLFSLLGKKMNSLPSKDSVSDLSSVLKNPDIDLDKERTLVIESGWAQWRGLGGIRYALRQAYFLYIFDEKPRLYNVLGDRDERHPLRFSDPVGRDIKIGFDSFLATKKWDKWEPLPSLLVSKLKLAQDLWRFNKISEGDFQELSHLSFLRSWDTQVQGWRAIFALKNSNWELLEESGKINQEPIWQFVGQKNSGTTGIDHKVFKGCGKIFYKYQNKVGKKASPQDCNDKLFLRLLDWILASEAVKKSTLRERFLRLYLRTKVDQKISRMNYFNGLNWHVAVDTITGPLLADLFLSLPGYKKYNKIVAIREKSWKFR